MECVDELNMNPRHYKEPETDTAEYSKGKPWWKKPVALCAVIMAVPVVFGFVTQCISVAGTPARIDFVEQQQKAQDKNTDAGFAQVNSNFTKVYQMMDDQKGQMDRIENMMLHFLQHDNAKSPCDNQTFPAASRTATNDLSSL